MAGDPRDWFAAGRGVPAGHVEQRKKGPTGGKQSLASQC